MNRGENSESTDLELVNKRLDHMLAISDYYRARKALITDSYYVLHYNEEMSKDRHKAVNDDQRRIAGLIDLVSVCTRRLEGTDVRNREGADIENLLNKAEGGKGDVLSLPDQTRS